jgi:hypothetical protein
MMRQIPNNKLHFVVVGFSSPWEERYLLFIRKSFSALYFNLARCVIALNVQIFEQIAPTHAKA